MDNNNFFNGFNNSYFKGISALSNFANILDTQNRNICEMAKPISNLLTVLDIQKTACENMAKPLSNFIATIDALNNDTYDRMTRPIVNMVSMYKDSISKLISLANLSFDMSTQYSETIGKAVKTLSNSAFIKEGFIQNTQGGYSKNNLNENEETLDFNSEDIEELIEDVNDVIKENISNDSFQIVQEKWNKKHPVIYDIVIGIIVDVIFAIIVATGNFGIDQLKLAFTKHSSNVYQDASQGSNVIIKVPSNTSVLIIENGKYFYKIIYSDESSNTDVEGWVAKINVKIQDK